MDKDRREFLQDKIGKAFHKLELRLLVGALLVLLLFVMMLYRLFSPDQVKISTFLTTASGQKLEESGFFDLQLTLFDKSSRQELWKQSFADVAVERGKFSVPLNLPAKLAEENQESYL